MIKITKVKAKETKRDKLARHLFTAVGAVSLVVGIGLTASSQTEQLKVTQQCEADKAQLIRQGNAAIQASQQHVANLFIQACSPKQGGQIDLGNIYLECKVIHKQKI